MRGKILAAVALTIAATGAFAASEVGRQIPAYTLPVPTTVSPQLQALISAARPSVARAEMPQTNAAWSAATNPDPQALHTRTVAMLDRLGLTLSEASFGGVHCYVVTPRKQHGSANRLLVHIHGGGYTIGAGESGISEAVLVAGVSGIPTISIDYHMPPDHPYPAPIDDAVAAWKAITARWPNKHIGLFGTSTGGAMVLAVTQKAIAEHLRTPDAIFAGTPWSDLTETGDSYFTNRYADPLVYRGGLSVQAAQYAHGIDLKDPRLSPIYGSFARFPPTLLLSGTRDLFLSNTIRVDRKLRDAGRRSELIVYEGISHGVYITGLDLPETMTALRDITAFFDRELR